MGLMIFTNAWRALLVGLAFAVGVQTCHATVVSLSALDRGWYTSFGEHTPSNSNYAVGQIQSRTYRNFFVFDLSDVVLSDVQTLVAAALVLDTLAIGTLDPFETVEFFDVTSPINDVINRVDGATGRSTFNDLGTGISYGTQTYSPSDSFTQKTIALNSSAVDAIRNSAGSLFAIGGSITTLRPVQQSATELIFGDNDAVPRTTRLDLTIVPEPSAFALAASSLIAVSVIRRRRPL